MSFVINTNVMSLVAQQNLSRSQDMLNQAITRLSSGRKINSAADDAAGQAIANRMTAQITGLSQAKSNANDGISLAQTTEGALDQINENLQRIRELSVQAANGTYSDSDLQSIQDEINERLAEINRVAKQTTFNGVHVLNDTQGIDIQVGDDDDEVITIQLQKISAKTLGLNNLDMTHQLTSDDVAGFDANGITEFGHTDASFDSLSVVTSGGSFSAVVGQDGELYVKSGSNYYDAHYDADTDTVTFNTSAGNALSAGDIGGGTVSAGTFVNSAGQLTQLSEVNNGSFDNQAAGASYEFYQANSSGQLIAVNTASGKAYDFTTSDISSSGQIKMSDMGSAGTISAGALSSNYTQATAGSIMSSAGNTVSVDLTSVNSKLGGTNELVQASDNGEYFIRHTAGSGEVSYYAVAEDGVNKDTGQVTLATDDQGNAVQTIVDPLAALDDALSQVDALRSNLGAMQNRFDSAIANLATTTTNLKAARSRIVDANYAKVVSQMSKAQILQQAGTSVLAQANASQQSVLALLR